MEHTVIAEIGTLVAIFAAICGIMFKWIAGLAENTQGMKDLRGEFEKWDKRNDDSHTELKTDIEKNRDEVNDEIIRNREEVNGTLIEHQHKLEDCRIDLDNHEARLQIIEKKK